MPGGELSAEDRALIDAKIEAGEVTRVADAEPKAKAQTKRLARLRRVHKMSLEGLTVEQIAEKEGVSLPTIYNDRKALGLTHTLRTRSGGSPEEIAERRKKVGEMVAEGITQEAMARRLGCSMATISADKRFLGLSKRRGRQGRVDKLSQKKERKVREKVAGLKDRRRFQVGAPAIGRAGRLASDEVVEEGRTVFPDRVFLPPGPNIETVLKDGSSNSKIGGDVLVGRLKGAYIATLTLQERATCPRDCPVYRECYGNNMQWSRRWAAGPELEESLRIEVAEACEANEKVLIRLHILGDFYSPEYVRLWADLLHRHPNLYVFGFTAWREATPIGKEVAALREMLPLRFMVRTSGRTGKWGTATLAVRPDPEIDGGWPKMIGDAIVCPEQRDPYLAEPQSRHCGNCAACWSTDAPILFVLH